MTLLLENFKLELKPAASSDADERVRTSRDVLRRTVLKFLGLSTVSCKDDADSNLNTNHLYEYKLLDVHLCGEIKHLVSEKGKFEIRKKINFWTFQTMKNPMQRANRS